MRVRYVGHVGRTSGYGRAAADNCMALLATGQVELEITPIGWDIDEARVALAGDYERLVPLCRADTHQRADVVIVHTLPLDCASMLAKAQAADPDLTDIPWVAFTTWEAASPPSKEVCEALAAFDQVWMPSMPASGAELEVLVVPHAFDGNSLAYRRATDHGERFVFYTIGAWNGRKNPAGVIRAFAMAFGGNPTANVGLRVHAPGADRNLVAAAIASTGIHPTYLPPVWTTTDRLASADVTSMHIGGSCFVSASRGESWNYPCFDAVLAGRHVIAPRGLGSDHYLEGTSAVRYGGMLVPAGLDVKITGITASGGPQMQTTGAQGMTSKDAWLEPDLCELAREMHDTPLDVREDGCAAPLHINYDPVERYGYPAVGRLMLSHLEDL